MKELIPASNLKDLGFLADEEIERLKKEGRLTGPTSSVPIETINIFLNRLGSCIKIENPAQIPPSASVMKIDATPPDKKYKEKMVLGIGYVQTAKGIEKAMLIYWLKLEE